jgi:hypothetical protein
LSDAHERGKAHAPGALGESSLERCSQDRETTKTGNTRRVPIHENLLPLLRAMHAESKGDGLVLALSSERTMARSLRR